MLTSAWFSRRDARRRGQDVGPGILMTAFWLLLGVFWLVMFGWQVVSAIATGYIEVSRSPVVFTSWAANPGGFALALGLNLGDVALGLLVIVLGLFGVRSRLSRRYGPAWT